MSAPITACGALGSDPIALEIRPRTGIWIAMTVATINVVIDANSEPEWLGVVTYGKQAEALARHAKGDPIKVTGYVLRRSHTTRDSLQVLACEVRTSASGKGEGQYREGTVDG